MCLLSNHYVPAWVNSFRVPSRGSFWVLNPLQNHMDPHFIWPWVQWTHCIDLSQTVVSCSLSPGSAISSTPPEKSGNFRGKKRPGRNMFLPPILEEMEETKNWWNISILAHVASWLDTPKENLELWLVEIGKNNIYSNLSLDLYILCHFNDVSGKFTICYYNVTILFRKYIKIRFTVLLSQLQNLGLHLKSIHLNIMTHCNFVQSAISKMNT